MLDFIVKDFQSLDEVKIRVEGLTLLVGESSSGKSACLRALYAATNNRFRNGQVQYGKDHSSVMIRVPESQDTLTVVRPYSGSVQMKLGNQTFSKLGRTLPSQVTEFLNLGNLDLADEKYSLTFHDQFQKPLLLEYSQKKVMELLSASKSLDDLNLCKDATQKARQENKGAFKAVDAILTETKESLSAIKVKVEQFTPLSDRLSSLEDSYISLDSEQEMLLDLESLLLELQKQDTLLSLYESLVNLSKCSMSLDSDIKEFSSLESLLLTRKQVNQNFALYSDILYKCDLDLVSEVQSITELSTLLPKVYELNESISTLERKSYLYREAASSDAEVLSIKGFISDLSLLDSYLIQLSSIDSSIADLTNVIENKLCPLCHSKLN